MKKIKIPQTDNIYGSVLITFSSYWTNTNERIIQSKPKIKIIKLCIGKYINWNWNFSLELTVYYYIEYNYSWTSSWWSMIFSCIEILLYYSVTSYSYFLWYQMWMFDIIMSYKFRWFNFFPISVKQYGLFSL